MRSALISFALLSIANAALISEYEWRYFDYDWETESRKNWYLQKGLYIPKNMIPVDVDRSTDERLFITVIRNPGVPATLHTVSPIQSKSGPLLRPYPNWSWYENKNLCDNIISVYRIAIDECNRLWVIDTGTVRDERLCPSKLLLFDLGSDELLLREEIDQHVAYNRNGTGLLVTPIVETRGRGCSNATVYIADAEGHGLVIWNNHEAVRLEADILKPEQRHAKLSIDRESIHLAKGVFGMALSPKLDSGLAKSASSSSFKGKDEEEEEEGDRYLYFQPLASRSLYGAETKVLRNGFVSNDVQYFGAVDVLPSQVTAQAFSSGGTLFYGLTKQMAIGCWHFKNPMVSKYFKILLTDRDRLQFVSGMKVIKIPTSSGQKEVLLMMTNRLQKIHARTLKLDEVNFRVLTTPIRNLIEGTVCDKNYEKSKR